MEKISHILKVIVKIKKNKNPVNLGVGLPSQFVQRYNWSKMVNTENVSNELMANKNTAFHWFQVFYAYDNCYNGRTYVQVLTTQSTSQICTQPIHDNKSTLIVINQRKMQMLCLLSHPRLV